VDHPSRGKKSTTQEEFEKLLQKKCPWHPGANHAAIDCYFGGRSVTLVVVRTTRSQQTWNPRMTTKRTKGATPSSRMLRRSSTSSSGEMGIWLQVGPEAASSGDHIR
jgi:hypothetical protein